MTACACARVVAARASWPVLSICAASSMLHAPPPHPKTTIPRHPPRVEELTRRLAAKLFDALFRARMQLRRPMSQRAAARAPCSLLQAVPNTQPTREPLRPPRVAASSCLYTNGLRRAVVEAVVRVLLRLSRRSFASCTHARTRTQLTRKHATNLPLSLPPDGLGALDGIAAQCNDQMHNKPSQARAMREEPEVR